MRNFEDGKCEVAVLGYPQTPILLERENGILDKLEELAPNAEVVANQPAINPTEGLDAMETILQAHPDVKVVCCIGGGGAAGANEAFKGHYGSEVPEDVGIFSTDLTDEAVASMENGEFNRMVLPLPEMHMPAARPFMILQSNVHRRRNGSQCIQRSDSGNNGESG